MNTFRLLASLFFAITLFGCSSYSVRQDYNESTDFSRLKTYAWTSSTYKNGKNAIANTSLIQKRIRSAVDLNLSKKGYRKVSHKNAHFFVRYHFYVTEAAQKGGVRTGVGVGASNQGNYGGLSLSFGGRKKEKSRLMIDVLNPRNKKLLWRGTTTGEFSGNDTPKENTENIYDGVEAIIKKFPPK